MINSKRQRVRGTGPSRKELPAFLELATVPDEVIDFLKLFLKSCPESTIGGDNYEIAKTIDVSKTFNVDKDNYKQFLIQTHLGEQASEFDYTEWVAGSDVLKDFLLTHFNAVYRSRISLMKPDHIIPWHIDTDPSVVCRAQICVSTGNNTFDFETKSGIESLKMQPGKMYFINTGWKHRVINGESDRIVLIFAFKFEDLKNNHLLSASK
jgi:hypothetical protein